MRLKINLVLNVLMFAAAAAYSATSSSNFLDEFVSFMLWLMPIVYALYNLYKWIAGICGWVHNTFDDEVIFAEGHDPKTGEVDLIFKCNAPQHAVPTIVDDNCPEFSDEILLYAKARVKTRVSNFLNEDGTTTLVYLDTGRTVKLKIKFPHNENKASSGEDKVSQSEDKAAGDKVAQGSENNASCVKDVPAGENTVQCDKEIPTPR